MDYTSFRHFGVGSTSNARRSDSIHYLTSPRVKCTWMQGTMPPCHDDVIKWKYFPRYWPLVWGIHRSPLNSPHKGQWRGALTLSLIRAWVNDGMNNREAGDLRHHRAHYDVIVMCSDKTVPVWLRFVVVWQSLFYPFPLGLFHFLWGQSNKSLSFREAILTKMGRCFTRITNALCHHNKASQNKTGCIILKCPNVVW